MNLSVFILAAGLGERLHPITNHIPKPLLPVLGKPVLESVLEKVSALPVTGIGVNLHYKKELIGQWIKQSAFSDKVTLFPEDPVLGTGGALKNAEGFLQDSAFLVHNADILSDVDLGKLIDFHISSGNIATLAVHNYPEFNRLIIDKKGFLNDLIKHPHPFPPPSMGREVKENTPPIRDIEYPDRSLSTTENDNGNSSPSSGGRGLGGGGTESIKSLAFTGIAVYQPDFLQFLPEGASSVVHGWTEAISAGQKIGTYDVSGCYWTDIGTPASYAKAVIHELRENGEMVYIHPSVDGCKHIELVGCVVVENISNPPSPPFSKGGDNPTIRGQEKFTDLDKPHGNIFLKNCILLSNNIIKDMIHNNVPLFFKGGKGGLLFENCILGPGFRIDLNESDLFDLSEDNNAILIGTGGSDRKYYRVKKNHHSAVLMQCAENDPDFQMHIEYTAFFRTYAVPVPELITTEPRSKTAIFEDLGDLSLYSWLKCSRLEDQVEEIYRRVLDILIPMHTAATAHVHECPLLNSRIFDYEYLRWETSYFLERFVRSVKDIQIKDLAALEEEFHGLASTVDSFPKTIVHRDFQSQNIMITNGGIPRVLDYQGARIGPPAYDVVSLLWDPYYRLQDSLRERLLDYYIHKVIPPHPSLEKGGNVNLNAEGNAASHNPPQSHFTKGGLRGITEKEFRESILPCRLQRHMQALGAYGFLSSAKGKKYFLKYVPEGLRLLKEGVALCKNEYTELYNLVGALE